MPARRQRYGGLGLFRIMGDGEAGETPAVRGGYGNWVRFAFLVLHKSAAAEIGFVSQKYEVGGHLVYENWVRFA